MALILKLIEGTLVALRKPKVWSMVTLIAGAAGVTLPPGLEQNIVLVASGLTGLLTVLSSIKSDSAVKSLQSNLRVKRDGWIGPKTKHAAELNLER